MKGFTISKDEQKYRELMELAKGRDMTHFNEKMKRSITIENQNAVLLDRLLKIKNKSSSLSKDKSKP